MAEGTELEHADVLVIGAGAGGSVATLRLAQAGARVVCLEQGPWVDRQSYPGTDPTWELQGGGRWSSSPTVRRLPADYPVDGTRSDMGALNFNGVGGGTVLYNAQWPRMLPDDFRVRSVDGVADDWPVTYDELLPFYEETDRQFGVSGLGGNPRYPEGADPPLPPLPLGKVGMEVARAHHRLGWHWWPATNAIASAEYRNQHVCVRRGSCGQGCNEGAKGSTDVTHWPDALAARGALVTGARVRRITVGRDGLATGADWVDRDGAEHHQRADVVLVAANGIGTPRLLLASADERHPDGLANSSGLVGRRLMLHPLATVQGVFPEPMQGWRAQNGALLQTLEFAHSDPSRGFVRGSTWGLGSSIGPLRTALGNRGSGVWGPAHHEHMAERLGRIGQWAILCEDLPEPENRVELHPTAVDSDGMPGVAVHYRLSENSRRMLEFMAERAAESLRAAGAIRDRGHLPDPERPPHGHGPHGRRPGHVGGRPVRDEPRHRQPRGRRRQRVRHGRLGQPHQHDRGAGPPHGRAPRRHPLMAAPAPCAGPHDRRRRSRRRSFVAPPTASPEPRSSTRPSGPASTPSPTR